MNDYSAPNDYLQYYNFYHQSDELYHYGVKGMKWGKNIFATDRPTISSNILDEAQQQYRKDNYEKNHVLKRSGIIQRSDGYLVDQTQLKTIIRQLSNTNRSGFFAERSSKEIKSKKKQHKENQVEENTIEKVKNLINNGKRLFSNLFEKVKNKLKSFRHSSENNNLEFGEELVHSFLNVFGDQIIV